MAFLRQEARVVKRFRIIEVFIKSGPAQLASRSSQRRRRAPHNGRSGGLSRMEMGEVAVDRENTVRACDPGPTVIKRSFLVTVEQGAEERLTPYRVYPT